MSEITWTVIDSEGTNLFKINYVPPIGSTLHYYIDTAFKLDEGQYNEDSVKHWNSIDGKYWKVKDVYCEVD